MSSAPNAVYAFCIDYTMVLGIQRTLKAIRVDLSILVFAGVGWFT